MQNIFIHYKLYGYCIDGLSAHQIFILIRLSKIHISEMLTLRNLAKIANTFYNLVLAEHNGNNISKNTNKLLSASHKFGEDVAILK